MSTYGTESPEGIKYVVIGAKVECDQGSQPSYLKTIYPRMPVGDDYVILEDERYFGNFSNDFGTCNSCYGRSDKKCMLTDFVDRWYGVKEDYKIGGASKYMEQYLTLMENCCEILKEIKTVTWAINDPGMFSLKNAYDDIADYQNHINNVYAWHNLDKVDEIFYTSDQLYYHEQLQEAQKNLNWAKEILDALTHQEHERFSPVLEDLVPSSVELEKT